MKCACNLDTHTWMIWKLLSFLEKSPTRHTNCGQPQTDWNQLLNSLSSKLLDCENLKNLWNWNLWIWNRSIYQHNFQTEFFFQTISNFTDKINGSNFEFKWFFRKFPYPRIHVSYLWSVFWMRDKCEAFALNCFMQTCEYKRNNKLFSVCLFSLPNPRSLLTRLTFFLVAHRLDWHGNFSFSWWNQHKIN